ncbi:PQQ-dependent sugar dehydrogenase [Paractinoplanes ferrugineus]|uniref:Oxidoreductase n=1 Tax=Paractinoplanes ferrugineus TaxID=113564 RepID=A0A919IWB1_9ACTN|nr:PQQ-dependent sugar dehydrogenase [Actinoplanes ferrugineus]GIE09007.1 oxidoreductase [Actinoplanes ferrugineus]
MIVRFRRARATALSLGAVLALTTACSFGPPDPDEQGAPPNLPKPSVSFSSEDQGDQEVAVTVLAKGLKVPWGMAFLPDGAALVTERDSGRILQVGPKSDANGLTVTEVQKLTEVQPSGDGGLLGIAVSPKYETDKAVFVYYSTAKDNRIGKLTLKGKLQPIVTGIPRSADGNGGALAFGPDNLLYAGTGDATNGTLAQNPKSLGGKILRMTTDGKPVADNPVKDSLVWSSGHRNVQGITWGADRKMYATESGQPRNGELNVIEKGKNYGWAKVDGAGNDPALVNPMQTWPTADSYCAGIAPVEQSLATACLLGQRIWLLNVTGNGTVLGSPQALLTKEYGRLRGLVLAPDGSLWASTSNQEPGGEPAPDDDRILRLVFSSGGAGRS